MNTHSALFSCRLESDELRALGLIHSYTIESFGRKQKLLWKCAVLEMFFPGQHGTSIVIPGADWQQAECWEEPAILTKDLEAQ